MGERFQQQEYSFPEVEDPEALFNAQTGYSARFFNYLAGVPSRESIKPDIEGYRYGDHIPVSEQGGVPQDANNFKRELYGLTAYASEEIWAIACAYRDENQGQLEEVTEEGADLIYSPMSEQKAKAKFDSADSVPELFYLLKRHGSSYVHSALESWYHMQEQYAADVPEVERPAEKQSRLVYGRFKRLMGENRNTTANSQDGVIVHTPVEHIAGGLNTGETFIVGIQQVILENFQRQYKRPITVEEFKQISESARALTMLICSIHDSVFPVVMRQVRFHDRHAMNNVLDRDAFTFSEEGDKKFLEIKKERLRNILQAIPSIDFHDAVLKCPALLAHGQKDKNVVAEMYDWYESLVEKYVLPRVQELYQTPTMET